MIIAILIGEDINEIVFLEMLDNNPGMIASKPGAVISPPVLGKENKQGAIIYDIIQGETENYGIQRVI